MQIQNVIQNRGVKLGQMVTESDRNWIHENYPVALIIADRAEIFKVHEDTVVFADSVALLDYVNENQYDSVEQVYSDLDSYIGPLQYLYTVTNEDLLSVAQDTLEDAPENQDRFHVVNAVASGEFDPVNIGQRNYILDPMIARLYVLAIIHITEHTKSMSHPETEAIVEESFAKANAAIEAAKVTEKSDMW